MIDTKRRTDIFLPKHALCYLSPPWWNWLRRINLKNTRVHRGKDHHST